MLCLSQSISEIGGWGCGDCRRTQENGCAYIQWFQAIIEIKKYTKVIGDPTF